MKYTFMMGLALVLALFSSAMTALGMQELFSAAGILILSLFITIDLGRFLLFTFLVDEWHNLRKIKYVIVIILSLLFLYSGAGVFSKLDSLISIETKEAMINAAAYNKAADNAQVKQTRSEDLAKIAQNEYNEALKWNKEDHANCMLRAQTNNNVPVAENKCNNTKRSLDNKASAALKEALRQADDTLNAVEETTLTSSKNQSEIANVLSTICKFTQKSCDSYDNLQNALTILILLVIIGVDYLQIAIVLAVNTRKNKKNIPENRQMNNLNAVDENTYLRADRQWTTIEPEINIPAKKINYRKPKLKVEIKEDPIKYDEIESIPLTEQQKEEAKDLIKTLGKRPTSFGPKPRATSVKPSSFSPAKDFLE